MNKISRIFAGSLASLLFFAALPGTLASGEGAHSDRSVIASLHPPVYDRDREVIDTDDLFGKDTLDQGLGSFWFTIDAGALEGGNITPQGQVLIFRNTDRTFIISAKEGFRIAAVYVDGVDVGPVSSYTFQDVKQFHTIIATFEIDDAPAADYYSDVTSDDWFYSYVNYVTRNHYMSSVEADRFVPNGTLTRGALLEGLYKMAGSPQVTNTTAFSDIPYSSPYYNFVTWGVSKGLVSGYSESYFGVNDPVTREQMGLIFWKYAGQPEMKSTAVLDQFTDSASISSWAKTGLAWAVENEFFTGMEDGSLGPVQNATRAQGAVLLYKLHQHKS